MTFIFQTDGKTIASVGIATILAQSVYVAATVTVLHTYILPYRAKNIFTPIKPTPTVPDYMAAISATVAVVVVRSVSVFVAVAVAAASSVAASIPVPLGL